MSEYDAGHGYPDGDSEVVYPNEALRKGFMVCATLMVGLGYATEEQLFEAVSMTEYRCAWATAGGSLTEEIHTMLAQLEIAVDGGPNE